LTLATLWRVANLVSWAADGRLDGDDVLPADWATLTTNLARLGPGAAALANMALVKVRDVSLLVRKMKSELGAGRDRVAEQYVQLVRETAMEAALLLSDAVAHCPRSHAQWPFDTDIPMKSKTGQSVVAAGHRVHDSAFGPPLATPHQRKRLPLEAADANTRYFVNAAGDERAYAFKRGESRR